MLDWILNPFGLNVGAYVVLWIGLVVIAVGSVIVAVVKAVTGRDS